MEDLLTIASIVMSTPCMFWTPLFTPWHTGLALEQASTGASPYQATMGKTLVQVPLSLLSTKIPRAWKPGPPQTPSPSGGDDTATSEKPLWSSLEWMWSTQTKKSFSAVCRTHYNRNSLRFQKHPGKCLHITWPLVRNHVTTQIWRHKETMKKRAGYRLLLVQLARKYWLNWPQ